MLVQRKPLAVCDATSVDDEDRIVYELVPVTPTAPCHESYSLNAHNSQRHKWYYYPEMTHDECMVFSQRKAEWRCECGCMNGLEV